MSHHRAEPTIPSRDDGAPIADVLWRSDELGSLEHCTVSRRDDGWTIDSTTVLAIGGQPGHIDAQVRTDGGWSTETVAVDVHGGRDRRIEIAVRDGEWTVDGERRPDLDGCCDVDLGWTPATNLLPVRRLALGTGDEATIPVAWLRFPEFEIHRTEQTYHRLADRTWRYRSGAADDVLEVDEHGLVVRYGDGLWTAVVSRGPATR